LLGVEHGGWVRGEVGEVGGLGEAVVDLKETVLTPSSERAGRVSACGPVLKAE
jgi:hypothetical protein